MAAADPTSRQAGLRVRSVVLGAGAFAQLKGKQTSWPGPRLEMRYLVEGAITLLCDDHQPELSQALVAQARGDLAQALKPNAADTTDSVGHRASVASEGATARTHGPATQARGERRSLRIDHAAFVAMQAIQEQTEPRLELRYLIDAGIAVLGRDAELERRWVQHARQALHQHLTQLLMQAPCVRPSATQFEEHP